MEFKLEHGTKETKDIKEGKVWCISKGFNYYVPRIARDLYKSDRLAVDQSATDRSMMDHSLNLPREGGSH